MKKILAVAFLFLASALNLKAQTTTTFTITVQAPPSCTVTLAPNPVSTGGSNLYSGIAGTINFNISACTSASSTATATWDGTALVLTYKAAVGSTPASLSAAITAAEATVGSHSLVLTIQLPTLAMNNDVTLPNAKVGVAYSVNLVTLTSLQVNGQTCTGCIFNCNSPCSLPAGLSLSSSGVVSGTPSSAVSSGSFSFTITDPTGALFLIKTARIET